MRPTSFIVSVATVTLLLVQAASAKPPSSTCDSAAVSDAQSAIDAACPCPGQTDETGTVVPWRNHGQYVSCVAKAVRGEARGHGLSRRCLKAAVPCAADSSCGKSSAVACINTTGSCLNDPAPGDTVSEGTCDNDSTKACDTDADCSQATCAISDSADECTLGGGTVSSGTCCTQ